MQLLFFLFLSLPLSVFLSLLHTHSLTERFWYNMEKALEEYYSPISPYTNLATLPAHTRWACPLADVDGCEDNVQGFMATTIQVESLEESLFVHLRSEEHKIVGPRDEKVRMKEGNGNV